MNAVERLKFWTQLYPMLLCGQPVAGETPWRLVCRPESMEGHDGLYGQKTRSKGSGEYSLSGAVIYKSPRRKAGAFAGLGHRFCGLIFVVGRTYCSSFLSWWCRRVKRTVPLTQKGQKALILWVFWPFLSFISNGILVYRYTYASRFSERMAGSADRRAVMSPRRCCRYASSSRRVVSASSRQLRISGARLSQQSFMHQTATAALPAQRGSSAVK